MPDDSHDEPKFPTVDDVLDLHEDAISAFGGSAGIRDRSDLQAAVEAPKATFGGEELYPEVPDKAAVYFDALITRHPFEDGNKRAAAVTSMTFLDQNGYELTCSSDELIEFGYEVAGGVRDRDSVRKWFR